MYTYVRAEAKQKLLNWQRTQNEIKVGIFSQESEGLETENKRHT